MSTPETRNSDIKGFNRFQREQGGIIPSQLKVGTSILVETTEYIYEFTPVDGHDGREYVLNTSSELCRGRRVVINLNSHSVELKHNIPNWIGKGMKLILRFKDASSIMTGQVKGASVIGKKTNGKTYNYKIWETTANIS